MPAGDGHPSLRTLATWRLSLVLSGIVVPLLLWRARRAGMDLAGIGLARLLAPSFASIACYLALMAALWDTRLLTPWRW